MVSILNIFTVINLTLLGALLFFRKNSTVETKILGLVIFIPATPFATNYLLYIGLINRFPALQFLSFNFLWAPFVLWYVLLMLGKKVKIKAKTFLHLVPYSLYITYFSWLLLQEDSYVQNFFYGVFHGNYPWEWVVLNLFMLIQCAAYLIYSYLKTLHFIRDYTKGEGISPTILSKIKWVKRFLEILMGLNLSAIVFSAIIPFETAVYLVCPLLYDVAFYAVIVGAIRNSSLFSQVEIFAHEGEKKNKEKYSGSCIAASQLENFYQKLCDHLKNKKPFLDPELSLKTLSDQLNISQHILSQVINQKSGKNFFDLINSYRLEEATKKLKSSEQTKFTIEGIGRECGFGSPTSFYRAFKKYTGQTPGQYINLQ